MLRRGRISLDEAFQALSIYQAIPVRFVDVDLEEALNLAEQPDLSAYDAYLIAAAGKHRCALATLDRGLVHAARQAGVQVLEVTG